MIPGSEWRNSFNIQYNNLFNGLAPGLNDYEISYYLTKAYKEMVHQYYTGFYSKGEGFEQTENARRLLQHLVKPRTIGTTGGTKDFAQRNFSIEDGKMKSYMLNIGDDVYRIVEESAKIVVEGQFKFVLVKPERHDFYWKIKNNPFRTVNEKRIWRFDVNDGPNKSIELISIYPITEYRFRYIQKPKAIIISDLSIGEFEGLELSVDGETKPFTPDIDLDLRDLIIDRAVELATKDYKENNLSNQVALNERPQ